VFGGQPNRLSESKTLTSDRTHSHCHEAQHRIHHPLFASRRYAGAGKSACRSCPTNHGSVTSFVHGVLLLTSRVGASRSPSRNLRLSCPPQGSVCSPISLHIVTSSLSLRPSRRRLGSRCLSLCRSMQSWKESKQGTAPVAAALSLGQDLAGNACGHFPMIGDFENATQQVGDRGYRYVNFEAGAIGPANVSRCRAS